MFERSLLITLFLGCSTQKAPTPMHADAAPAQAISACKADTDCELVDASCCNCNEGGKRIAVVKGHAPKRECEGVMCPQIVSNDPSCRAIARAYCKQGTCAVSGVNDSVKDSGLK
jgi:hypothetical protein